jgi:putative PIN family toxin of toxin-antitoxin system
MKEKIKVTLDTNVLVSGTFWKGNSFKILDLIHKGFIECYLSNDILKEYYKIIFSNEIIEKNTFYKVLALKIILFDTVLVFPSEKFNIIIEDPEDNKILECAFSGNSNFIVTHDKHLLKMKSFKDINIVTPKDFLKYFQENKQKVYK